MWLMIFNHRASWVIGPPQVKCRLLISSIFDTMNFQHFLEMLKIMLQHFPKMLEILASKMLEIRSRHLSWTIIDICVLLSTESWVEKSGLGPFLWTKNFSRTPPCPELVMHKFCYFLHIAVCIKLNPMWKDISTITGEYLNTSISNILQKYVSTKYLKNVLHR